MKLRGVRYRLVWGCIALILLLAAPAIARDYHFGLASDGSGDFKMVQEAINAVPDFRKNETLIFIKKGTYMEKLALTASTTYIVLIGEARESTILTYDD